MCERDPHTLLVSAQRPDRHSDPTGEFRAQLGYAVAFFLLNQCLVTAISWLLDAGLSETCRWDCGWYVSIVAEGYHGEPTAHVRKDAANWAFFPLYPYLAFAFGTLFDLQAALALVLTGKLSFFLAIIAFIRMIRTVDPTIPAGIAGFAVAFHPFSLHANVGYSEPLFLATSCLALTAMRNATPLRAGLLGGLCACTRFVGVFLTLPYVITFAREFLHKPGARSSIVLGLLLLPFGLGLFMLFLYERTGDALAFAHVQRAWENASWPPFRDVLLLIRQVWSTPLASKSALLSVMSLSASAFACFWLCLRRHVDLALFLGATTLIPAAATANSLSRYIWWQAPILLTFCWALRHRTFRWPVIALSVVVSGVFHYFWLAQAPHFLI